MNRLTQLFILLAGITVPCSAGVFDQESIDAAVAAFYASKLGDSTAYNVNQLEIKRDIATFTLKSGTLFLAAPIMGSARAAVFIGEGSAAIKPVRPLDRRALDLAAKDHLGKAVGGQIVTAFDQLMIATLDGSLEEVVKSSGDPGAGPDPAAASAVLKDRLQMMWNLEIPFDLEMLAVKAGVPGGPTYISFKSADHGWLEYTYEPREMLEVGLTRIEEVGSTVRRRILINSHATSDFDAAGNYVGHVTDRKDWIDVEHYELKITIPTMAKFDVEGTVTFISLIDDLQVVPFDIVNNVAGRRSNDQSSKQITLTGFRSADGTALPFVHRKHQAWVGLPEPLARGAHATLGFTVEADAVFQISSKHHFIVNDAAWYPQHGYGGGEATMDWTVKAKKPLYATGSGKMVKEASEGQYNVTQLVFDRPVWLPFLIFGDYEKQTDVYEPAGGSAATELAVFFSPRADFTVEDSQGDYYSYSVTVPGSKPKGILAETKEIIKFYESLYGPFPFGQIHVAQMSPGMGFGQGPAGFIQLTGEAFMSSAEIANFGGGTANADFFHEFFSHEMAHQYWGHAIKWATDEDVWLSESFAEYTAGLYVLGLLGRERFQDKLQQWREEALIGDPHAPVAWANCVTGVNAGSWRTSLLYYKGPYVVHMLRMQVGHDNYVKAMKSLMGKYSHQSITTDMLVAEFEQVAGYKLDYFFDQWFRNTGIPTFDYSTEVTQTEDGKYLATVKIKQRDPEKAKLVLMPISLNFGKDKVIVRNHPVLKAEDTFQIKLPSRPESITLDDDRTLLADIVRKEEPVF